MAKKKEAAAPKAAPKTTAKPAFKKSKKMASKQNFAGKELKGEIFEDEVLADANFAGAILTGCSFPNLTKALHCDFSNMTFDINPFEKVVKTKEKQGEGDDVKEVTVENTVHAEIINCDVNGTDLACQRIPFA